MSGLDWLLSAVTGTIAPVVQTACSAITSPDDRRSWSGRHRAHLEVRGLHLQGTQQAADELTGRLDELDGVDRSEINRTLGRAVIQRDGDVVSEADLTQVVSEVEREHGLDQADHAPAGETHPANADALLREVGALGASLLGMGYTAIGSLLPVRAVPSVVPAVVSLVDSVPWLRHQAVTRLGRTTADTTLALGGAVSQSLSRNPMAVFTDSCSRFCSSREALARIQSWHRWEENSESWTHRAEPLDMPPARPCPLPDGPVERVSNLAGGLALAGYGTVLAATRNPQRALAALLAGMPRPAKAGREAFAAQLTTTLSGRGSLVFDRQALRRLDRVDTVVLDARALLTGRRVVDSVAPLDPDAGPAEMFERASELVDPQRPGARRRRGSWASAPLAKSAELPEHLQHAPETAAARGATVVGLHHEGHLVALVTVVDQLHPLAEALVDAAGTVGEVVIAGGGERLGRRLNSDRASTSRHQLVRSVQGLQEEGHTVAVVSAEADASLIAADVSIGLARPSSPVPWGAHLLCPNEATVHMLLLAVHNARAASRYAAGISTAASCLAAIFGSLGPATGAAGRASTPVQTATLLALATGTWCGVLARGQCFPGAA